MIIYYFLLLLIPAIAWWRGGPKGGVWVTGSERSHYCHRLCTWKKVTGWLTETELVKATHNFVRAKTKIWIGWFGYVTSHFYSLTKANYHLNVFTFSRTRLCDLRFILLVCNLPLLGMLCYCQHLKLTVNPVMARAFLQTNTGTEGSRL